MFRFSFVLACFAISAVGFAAPVIIEDFENIDDPANWQVNLTPGHTLNATVQGNVPDYVTSGTSNLAAQFKATWETATPTSHPVNLYDPAGPTTYWGVRFNINAPTSLPNNAIPTSTGLLQADMINNSAYPVKVALVVDTAAVSQLERGPLVDVPAGASVTYSWDFATVPPVGFDTGDGVFSGNVQRVKSLLVYTPTSPTAAALNLQVDNIRNGNAAPVEIPDTPKMLSLQQGAAAGEAIVTWEVASDPSLTGFNIYVASDANFGTPLVNHLTFPGTPEMSVGAAVRSATLTNITAGQNIYVTVTATNGSQESPLGQALAARLNADGAAPLDRLILDNDDYAPGTPNYTAKAYAQAAVYTALALDGLNRSFDSATAAAVESGDVTLTPSELGAVIWSNLDDGAAAESISLVSLARISDYIEDGGKLLISGTNFAEDLAARDPLLLANFRASLVSGDLSVSDITPVRQLASVGAISTACNPATFPVAYATTQNDAILPAGLSIEQALYTGVPRNGGVAAVGFGKQVLLLGFAFETAGDPAGAAATLQIRENLMQSILDYLLGPGTAAKDWQLFPGN